MLRFEEDGKHQPLEKKMKYLSESSLNDTRKAITQYHLPDYEKTVSVSSSS